MVMGAPLRLDLGFPLQTDSSNDQSHEFNFSVWNTFLSNFAQPLLLTKQVST